MTDRWISFDCYGTLVDWRTGLLAALESVTPGHGEAMLALHRRIEGEIEAGEFLPYREVLARSLERMAAEVGVAVAPDRRDVLAETLPGWPLYPDTGPGLQALADDGWKLAILSNVDDDLIAGTLTQFPVAIDCVVTAEDVGSYKPGPAHFEELLRRTGLAPGRWVHAAVDLRYDLVPAGRLGAATVWVDREHDGPTDLPLFAHVATVGELAAAVHHHGVTP